MSSVKGFSIKVRVLPQPLLHESAAALSGLSYFIPRTILLYSENYLGSRALRAGLLAQSPGTFGAPRAGPCLVTDPENAK